VPPPGTPGIRALGDLPRDANHLRGSVSASPVDVTPQPERETPSARHLLMWRVETRDVRSDRSCEAARPLKACASSVSHLPASGSRSRKEREHEEARVLRQGRLRPGIKPVRPRAGRDPLSSRAALLRGGFRDPGGLAEGSRGRFLAETIAAAGRPQYNLAWRDWPSPGGWRWPSGWMGPGRP
jgi:hypothetical protein